MRLARLLWTPQRRVPGGVFLRGGPDANRTATIHGLVVVPGFAATMLVNSAADTIDHNDGALSLREAIDLANGTLSFGALSRQEQAKVLPVRGTVNTITFDSGLNGSTLTLSTVGDTGFGPSAFLVNSSVVIEIGRASCRERVGISGGAVVV